MAIRAEKKAFNLREKLSELDRPVGSHGSQLLNSNSLKETCGLVGLSGRRNLVRNGSFDIWQRGTSFTSITSSRWTADGWRMYGASGSVSQVTRETFSLGQKDVPGNPKYFLRADMTPDTNDTSWLELQHYFEDVTRFSDCWVTLSFWARTNTNQAQYVTSKATYWAFYTNFGSGGSPSSQTRPAHTPKFALNIFWTYYEFPVYLPSIQGKTLGTDVNSSYMKIHLMQEPNAMTGDTYVDFANVQLEYGRGATPFERRPIDEELAFNQRYFWREYGGVYHYEPGPTNGAGVLGQGQHPVTMRTKPTMSHNCSGNSNGSSLSGNTTVGIWTWYKQNSGYDGGHSSYQAVANWNFSNSEKGIHWNGGSYNFRPSDEGGTTGINLGVNTYVQASAELV